MKFVYDDGGRRAAGFKGDARDCVVRAVSIASGMPYPIIYSAFADINSKYRGRATKGSRGVRSARNGVFVRAEAFKRYMRCIGFEWTPTMLIGQGCRVHLDDRELPAGRLVVSRCAPVERRRCRDEDEEERLERDAVRAHARAGSGRTRTVRRTRGRRSSSSATQIPSISSWSTIIVTPDSCWSVSAEIPYAPR